MNSPNKYVVSLMAFRLHDSKIQKIEAVYIGYFEHPSRF